FQAIEHGEITLDTLVTVSKNAASEPPSKLGLRPGQKIALRYLIRAAAVKSANDAATAIGEAISGSESAFAARMNRMAKALGMKRSHFLNANGLTQAGHMSTARDMTILGRHLFFDYPQYYNLFSRRTADVGGRSVPNTNRRFLNSYKGADGIKTGYTSAAGFNLVASAQRGQKRIIATIFGGRSTAARNKRMAELLDLGFRSVPERVAIRRPAKPPYEGPDGSGRIVRLVGAPLRSIRPEPRPDVPPRDEVIAIAESVDSVVEDLVSEPAPRPAAEDVAAGPDPVPSDGTPGNAPLATPVPPPRPAKIILTSAGDTPEAVPDPVEVVTRLSTAGGRDWAINIGTYASNYEAERVLLKTALAEMATLSEALRKVARGRTGFEANFVGLTEEGARLACRRLAARDTACTVIGPG
ncbi:MAG: D-alanyl-D-alanine carboxypeptidase, partial [Alphaproteobacteria bacterium]